MLPTWLWLLITTGILYLVKIIIVRISSISEERSRKYGVHVSTSIIENPIAMAFFVLLISTLLVISITISYFEYKDTFYEGVMVEAHGMLLDIAVIGVLILWLSQLGEKRREIKRYLEEIDDFRGWKSKEAGYRIAGNIKRLNRHGITQINLSQCYLNSTDLNGIKLRGAILQKAKLRGAELWEADLQGADLRGAELEGAILRWGNLQKADLRGAELEGTKLWGADLKGADLQDANLKGADLRNVRNLTIAQLSTAGSLIGTLLDSKLKREIDRIV
jgi:BTB/POZ domain-containing protein KCTD9